MKKASDYFNPFIKIILKHFLFPENNKNNQNQKSFEMIKINLLVTLARYVFITLPYNNAPIVFARYTYSCFLNKNST